MATTSQTNAPVRVAIIGAGHVGAAFAFALVRSGVASEIVLIDKERARAEGEAMDLEHAVPFGRPTRVWAGSLEDCAGADVVAITAGAGQRPGETRLDLVKRNADVLRTLVPEIAARAGDATLVVASNPVDVLTMGARQLSGFPRSRVIGTGTIIDTARLRFLLSQHFDVDPRSVHAHVVGEHGDSEVVVWSAANIAGIPLHALAHPGPFGDAERKVITRKTREAAYAIIERKGHTAFAIAAGLVRIVESIVRNERSVLSVSTQVELGDDLEPVCLSLPSVVGKGGVERTLPLALDAHEREALLQSAAAIRHAATSVGFAL